LRKTLALVALTVIALALAACDRGPPRSFSFVAGSENTVLQPIVETFCKQQNTQCSFKYEGSLDIGLALQGDTAIDADAVWPAASVWIDLFDSGRKVKNLTSIAQMPVILGVRKSKAEALGWVGKAVVMADILEAVQAKQLSFLMTSATQSNSGASAYLAMLSAALGGKAVIEPGDLDNPAVRSTVQALLQGVTRSSGSSGWLADLYVEGAKSGTAYDAMWNYEAVLKETNDRLKPLGQEPLYAIYPSDGVAVADSPLGFIDRGTGKDRETFFAGLVAYLQSPAVQEQIAATGRRLPFSSDTAGAAAEPDWNFDPSHLVTAIRLPEPAVIRQALELYQSALRKPSLSALCLDFSGSMSGDGETQLQAAMQFLLTPERVGEVLVQWSPGDRIIVLPFDGAVRGSLEATGEPEAQAALLSEVRAEHANGGTDMYACASAALDNIAATTNLDAFLPAILILTDGRSEGDAGAFLAKWREMTLHIPVFGITFGDADKTQLDALATATSARVFDGHGDLAGAFRAARGYN